MVLFLRLGTDRGIGAELSGTGQEAWAPWALVSLSCLSRQLEVFDLNPGFEADPAAPVAVGEVRAASRPHQRN